jgi:hypothetical protein
VNNNKVLMIFMDYGDRGAAEHYHELGYCSKVQLLEQYTRLRVVHRSLRKHSYHEEFSSS